LYFSQNGHQIEEDEMGKACRKTLTESLNRKDHLEDISLDGIVML